MCQLRQACAFRCWIAIVRHNSCPVVIDWRALEDEDEGRRNTKGDSIHEIPNQSDFEPVLLDEKQAGIDEEDGELDEHDARRPKYRNDPVVLHSLSQHTEASDQRQDSLYTCAAGHTVHSGPLKVPVIDAAQHRPPYSEMKQSIAHRQL